jgi:UDP-glucose 4-epimerase
LGEVNREMKKVLITGGAGFIGYHLGRNLLGNGYRIDLLDNFSRGVRDSSLLELSRQDGVNVIDTDLLDVSISERLDKDYSLIFHLAATVGVPNVLRAPYAVLVNNVGSLQNMILLGQRQECLARFVFPSTSEVYAGTLRYFSLGIPTPESVPLTVTELSEKRTSYMLSKIYGEALCLHSGLPTTIIRPHNFYGPRMGLSHVVPELCQKAFESEDGELRVFSVSHKRTFCYVDDAVEMVRLLAESEEAVGEVFNVGNQAPETSIEDLAGKIISVVGKALTIHPEPETPGSPMRRCPDMSKTYKVTGYKSRVDLDEGIERTFE